MKNSLFVFYCVSIKLIMDSMTKRTLIKKNFFDISTRPNISHFHSHIRINHITRIIIYYPIVRNTKMRRHTHKCNEHRSGPVHCTITVSDLSHQFSISNYAWSKWATMNIWPKELWSNVLSRWPASITFIHCFMNYLPANVFPCIDKCDYLIEEKVLRQMFLRLYVQFDETADRISQFIVAVSDPITLHPLFQIDWSDNVIQFES